jgi:hypothetical protein
MPGRAIVIPGLPIVMPGRAIVMPGRAIVMPGRDPGIRASTEPRLVPGSGPGTTAGAAGMTDGTCFGVSVLKFSGDEP